MDDTSTRPGVRVRALALVLRRLAGFWPFAPAELAGLPVLVRPGAVCLDVGAGFGGAYTWSLSALAGPTGRVHSVELRYGPARWLTAVTALLGRGNVTVHRGALGPPTRGDAVAEATRACNVVQLPLHGVQSEPVATIDGLCRRLGLDQVDFIKADAGTAGTALLVGAFETLLRDRPSLLLEIGADRLAGYGNASVDLVRSLTVSLGYGMYRWRRQGSWEPVANTTADCHRYLFVAHQPLPARPLPHGSAR